MRTLAFDTLEFAKKLQAANFTAEQAEALATSIAGLVEERLATKQDLKELETRLEARIKELETGLRHDMKELETSLRHDLKELELRLRHDLTLRLGAMLAAAVAIVAALVKLL
jgi:predicted phage-related endonuclease